MPIRTDLPTNETLESSLLSSVNVDLSQLDSYPEHFPFDKQGPNSFKDIDMFDDVLRTVLHSKQEGEGVPEGKRLIISHAEPDKEFTSETVTVKLISRVPGAWGRGKPGAPSNRVLSPRQLDEKDDPENPGHKIITMWQGFDNVIEISNWALTSKRASTTSLWLQDALVEYAWYFALEGFGKLLFLERKEDKSISPNSASRIFERPMRYYIRTQRITTISEVKLRKLRINLVAQTQ